MYTVEPFFDILEVAVALSKTEPIIRLLSLACKQVSYFQYFRLFRYSVRASKTAIEVGVDLFRKEIEFS